MVKQSGYYDTVGSGAGRGALVGGLAGAISGTGIMGTGDLINTPDKENHKVRHRLRNILTGGLAGVGVGGLLGGGIGAITNINSNNDAIETLISGLHATKRELKANTYDDERNRQYVNHLANLYKMTNP